MYVTDVIFFSLTKFVLTWPAVILLNLFHKSHNALLKYPTIYQSCNSNVHICAHMCTFLLQNGALWDLCNRWITGGGPGQRTYASRGQKAISWSDSGSEDLTTTRSSCVGISPEPGSRVAAGKVHAMLDIVDIEDLSPPSVVVPLSTDSMVEVALSACEDVSVPVVVDKSRLFVRAASMTDLDVGRV